MIGMFFSFLVGSIVVFPFMISIILLLFHRSMGRKMTIKRLADYTTVFLFLSVYVIAYSIFGEGVGPIIAIASIVIVLIFAVFERKHVKEFHIIHLLRKVWRLFFIILIIVYFLLMIIGIILTINTHLA